MLRTALVLAAVVSSDAASYTWTGAAPNNLWDNGNNWSPVGVPTTDDDCTIDKATSVVLVGDAAGALCGKTTVAKDVTLQIQGSKASFTNLMNAGTVNIDGGAYGLFTTAGTQNMGVVNWKSGFMSGPFDNKKGGTVVMGSAGGQLTCTGAWTNEGEVRVVDSRVSMCDLVNNGKFSFPAGGPAGKVTVMPKFMVDAKSTGSIEVNSAVEVGQAALKNVALSGTAEAPAELTAAPGASATIDGCSVDKASVIGAGLGPATVKINNLTCDGVINTNGPAATLMVTHASAINSVLLQNGGKIQIASDCKVNNIVAVDGELQTDGKLVVSDIKSSAPGAAFRLSGAGSVKVDTAMFKDRVSIAVPTTISTSAAFSCKSVTVDATLTFPKGCTVNIGDMAGFWGPSNAAKPGSIVLMGDLTVGMPNVTINSVDISGGGNIYVVDNSTIDFQSMSVTAGAVALKAAGATVHGESLQLSYTKLEGPKSGSIIGILNAPSYSTCKSPCAASNATVRVQTYLARVVSTN